MTRVKAFRRPIAPFVALLVAAAAASAAIPKLSPDELKERATHIVVGDVRAVYSAEVGDRPDYSDRKFCIELTPSAIEKGEGLKEGRVHYARTWKPGKRPQGWTGSQGQNTIPQPRQQVRLFLRESKDGGLDVLDPNGVEVMGDRK
jgi:hypothetical protein